MDKKQYTKIEKEQKDRKQYIQIENEQKDKKTIHTNRKRKRRMKNNTHK